jgi:hypothetical protein
MALNRIIADSIADGTVIASDIADGTITLAKLQSGLLPSAAANSAAAYANAAFATANTVANNTTIASSYANSAFAAANAATATDATQNTNITNVGTYANSAFSKANSVVTSISAGTGISVSGATGAVTVSATSGGVTSLNGQTGAVTTTSINSVGSLMIAAVNTTDNIIPNNTYSGGDLYYATQITQAYDNRILFIEGNNTTKPRTLVNINGYVQYPSLYGMGKTNNGNTGFQTPGGSATLSGTWRLTSNCVIARQYDYNSDNNLATSTMFNGWFVRVS